MQTGINRDPHVQIFAYGDLVTKSPYAYNNHMQMISDKTIPICIWWSYGDPRIHTVIPICIRGYVCFLWDGCTSSYVDSKHLQPPPDLILSKIVPKEFVEKVFLK